MSDEDLHKKLADVMKRRDALRSKRDTLVGTLSAAQARREEIRQKCKDKNIDPDKLEETIASVRALYEAKVNEIIGEVDEIEKNLAAYEGKRG